MTQAEYDSLLDDYGFLPTWRPSYPKPDQKAFPPPPGKITFYADHFRFCHLRLPCTRFLMHVLEVYQVHISQMHPLGLARVTHFEFVMRSLGRKPRLSLFHAFFKCKKDGGWYSFDKRNASKNLIDLQPQSSKDKSWRSKFFFVDAGVMPGDMVLRLNEEKVFDEAPLKQEFESAEYLYLVKHASDIQPLPEHALVALRMSRRWSEPGFRPSYQRKGGGSFSYFELLFPVNRDELEPIKVPLEPCETTFLDQTRDLFVFPSLKGDFDFSVAHTRGVEVFVKLSHPFCCCLRYVVKCVVCFYFRLNQRC